MSYKKKLCVYMSYKKKLCVYMSFNIKRHIYTSVISWCSRRGFRLIHPILWRYSDRWRLLKALLIVVDARELSSLCNCASVTEGSSPGTSLSTPQLRFLNPEKAQIVSRGVTVDCSMSRQRRNVTVEREDWNAHSSWMEEHEDACSYSLLNNK